MSGTPTDGIMSLVKTDKGCPKGAINTPRFCAGHLPATALVRFSVSASGMPIAIHNCHRIYRDFYFHHHYYGDGASRAVRHCPEIRLDFVCLHAGVYHRPCIYLN